MLQHPANSIHSADKQISSPSEKNRISESYKVVFFLFLSLVFIIPAFFYNTPHEIWTGCIKILLSPANLLTDYIQLANIGAALVNVGIMILVSVGMVKVNGLVIDGKIIAAIFTVAGFSFFGKNLFNSIPITLGVLLFAKIKRKKFKDYILQALFGTA